MPCFSKNGSVDRFIVPSRYTSLAIASFAMLNIVGYTNDISKRVQGCFLARDIFYEDMFSYIQEPVNGKFLPIRLQQSERRSLRSEHMKVFSATFYTRRLSASPKAAASEFCVQTVIVFAGEKFSIEHNIINMFLFNYYISNRKNGFLEKGLSEAKNF